MTFKELEAQAKALAPIIKGAIDRALESVRASLSSEIKAQGDQLKLDVAESLKAIPIASDIAKQAAALIEKPADGRDADPEAIKAAVAQAIAEIPVPKDGENGKSITAEDARPLIAEEVDKAIAALPVPKDGKSVPMEDVQRMVDEAVSKAVAAISLPKDGEPGRDAAHLEILPEIDESKSYARGSYAKHAGGLWRSYERTNGIKGWECIVEGIAGLSIEQDGERGFKAIATMSSGATCEKTVSLPVVIYRGVFTPQEYQAGDAVTFGGSLWHCNATTSDKPGEPGSKGWTLAVKRGRDGKDLRDNASTHVQGAPVKLS